MFPRKFSSLCQSSITVAHGIQNVRSEVVTYFTNGKLEGFGALHVCVLQPIFFNYSGRGTEIFMIQKLTFAKFITVNKVKQVQLQWAPGIYKWKLLAKIFLIVPML